MRGPEGHGSTKSGAFRGKLCYAAPETVEGEPATPRSDQYSAAVMLLEMLTGETPFVADSVVETFRRMVYEVPDPASKFRDDIPEALDQALGRALAKDPTDRFESALAFSRELRSFQKDADEDIAQVLKQLVSQEFELLPGAVGVEALKDREAALEKILSVVPPSTAPHCLPACHLCRVCPARISGESIGSAGRVAPGPRDRPAGERVGHGARHQG